MAGVRRAWPLPGLWARGEESRQSGGEFGRALSACGTACRVPSLPQDAPLGPQQKEPSSGARAGEQSPCVLFWDREPRGGQSPFQQQPRSFHRSRSTWPPGSWGQAGQGDASDDSEIAHKDGHWASLGVASSNLSSALRRSPERALLAGFSETPGARAAPALATRLKTGPVLGRLGRGLMDRGSPQSRPSPCRDHSLGRLQLTGTTAHSKGRHSSWGNRAQWGHSP